MLQRLAAWCFLVPLVACSSAASDSDGTGEGDGTTTDASTTTTDASDASTTENDDESTSSTGDPAGSESSSTGAEPLEPAEMLLMDTVIFYDGYAETVDEPIPEGIVRLNNAVNAVKLTDTQLDLIQPNLEMQVLIGALCDNYDRIGSVNLAFTDKGAETYVPGEVMRLEVARFITPFMNKNYQPDTVPYDWNISHIASVLRDPAIREAYDIWFELDVFGVPYAANTEVSGCDGRNDVFRGWLALRTDSTAEEQVTDTLIPLAMKETFNDYQKGASDELGSTRKTVEFEVPEDQADARLVLITSNHGANAGGEEYSRREHFVYVDGDLALQYRPGRETCEPFREYNTQGNGIYGPTPRTDEEWQSFSNWCPGDVIDTRIIEWGPVSAGMHEFMIDVPDAEFADDQGNFPFSLFILGTRQG